MSETTSTADVQPNTDAPSSSAVETPSAPAPSAPADASTSPSSSDTAATPSPSQGDSRQSDREGLLAAVRSVVDKKSEPAATEGEAGDTSIGDTATGAQDTKRADETTSQNDDDPNAPDPSEAELKQYRPKTRRNFERILRQRNEARQAYAAIEPELRAGRDLQSRIQQAQLAPDDLNQLLFIGSSLRTQNYQAFLEGVTPYVMAAQEALGLRIARDLQGQVDDGTLSEDAARELTRTRHRAAQAEQRLKDSDSARSTDRDVRTVQDIRTAVETWEAGIRSRDPDYAHKADTVRRFSQGAMQERGIPRTPQEAVALVQRAYDDAGRLFKSVQPVPRATARTPSSVHVATGGSVNTQPQTMKEAALMALAAMRRTA